MPLITGYKLAGRGYTHLVTLRIDPEDTNMGRSDVADPNRAKHRCRRAFVESIVDMATGEPVEEVYTGYIESSNFFGPEIPSKFMYRTGQMVEEPEFDTNLDLVCAKGIHFYASNVFAWGHGEATFAQDIDEKGNGVMRMWHDNGQLANKYEVSGWEKDGVYESWYADGAKKSAGTYKNGFYHGTFSVWYQHGAQKEEGMWVDGKRDGTTKLWYSNGVLHSTCNYRLGKLHGPQQFYNEDGVLAFESEFDNGNCGDTASYYYINRIITGKRSEFPPHVDTRISYFLLNCYMGVRIYFNDPDKREFIPQNFY